MNQTIQGQVAPINGLNLYYEIHGTGQPLILLHGAFGVVGMFEHLIPTLAATRQVIGVELQGHGHTADIDRPLSIEQMADDVAALIEYLGLEQADVCGYSMGGGTALQLAIRHPNLVRKLIILATVYKRNGWQPSSLAGMEMVNGAAAATWVGSPMHTAYAAVAPHPEAWTTLGDKMGALLKHDYDWTEGVAALTMPTLIGLGDTDGIRLDHAVEMFSLLGGGKGDDPMGMKIKSQLAILPATTHLNILERADLLLPIIQGFLDAPLPETK